jgi:hypothetical protein
LTLSYRVVRIVWPIRDHFGFGFERSSAKHLQAAAFPVNYYPKGAADVFIHHRNLSARRDGRRHVSGGFIETNGHGGLSKTESLPG